MKDVVMKRCCLVIVEDLKNNKLLMVENKRGINKGFYNFPGGKIEINETIEDGAIRENIEETGIKPLKLKTLGKIEFQPVDIITYIYYTDQFDGQLKLSNKDENNAFWVDKNNIPFDKMRETDVVWIKDVINKKQINKRLHFDKNFGLEKIEDIFENIEKYKNKYNKFKKNRKYKYLQNKKQNVK